MASKKRGQNEGTIAQRKDGRWEARVSVGYEGGKHIRKCLYGSTREEVAQKMVTALANVQRGTNMPNEKFTVEKFLQTWLEDTAKARLRQSTHARYSILIRLHITPHIGRLSLAKLTPTQVQRVWATLKTGGLAPRTIIQCRAILRTALNQAVRHGLATRNSAALSDAPKAATFNATFLTASQAETLLDAAREHKLDAIVTLALTSGMRVGEMLGLTWGDIDFENRFISIKRQQQRVGKDLIICDPKTERSARTLPLTNLAVDALKRHRERQVIEAREGLGHGRMITGRVFTNEKGAPLENATVLRQFQKLVEDAKLPRMRLHDLRHSCATLLLSKGIHPRVVMELLGHSTIAMTMNVYSHVVPEIARGAADAMDGTFKRPASG